MNCSMGEELLKINVHYWVGIRLRAVVKFFLEKKQKGNTCSQRRKGTQKETEH